jgi:hypothetical protein
LPASPTFKAGDVALLSRLTAEIEARLWTGVES